MGNFARQCLLMSTLFQLGFVCDAGSQALGNCSSTEESCTSVAIQQISERQKISAINIRIHPIFDESIPEENNFLFRLANRLHIATDPDVVRNDLLVKEGEVLDENRLIESERILRTKRFFNKASVTTETLDNEQVEVNVDVNEVWTLLPTLSFSRSGGDSQSTFGFQDSNFLGYGKSFTVSRSRSSERNGTLFEYSDPNTGWHQTNLSLVYENNDDGYRHYFSFKRPYFTLSTPNAGGVSYKNYEQQQSVYNAGDKVDTYGRISKEQEFFYGGKFYMSADRHVHRWNIGYSMRKDNFFRVLDEPNIITLPQDREFNALWFEYEYIQDKYTEAFNVQQINRVEDINYGLQARLRIGYAASMSNNYDNSYQLSGEMTRGFYFNEKHIVLAAINFGGFYDAGQIYDGSVNAAVNYHWKNFERGQFYIGMQGSRGLRLFGDNALVLGGDSGLRGYPDNYEAGDKRYLLSLEQRFYGRKEWFSLFHAGLAVFYDQGRAWGDSLVIQDQDEQLRDVGVGLRFSGTRNGSRDSGSHNVLHLDVAKPLDGDSDIDGLQWLVKVQTSF
jgi:outer membrane protein assembly factor BamA